MKKEEKLSSPHVSMRQKDKSPIGRKLLENKIKSMKAALRGFASISPRFKAQLMRKI
jgi:hypothetical protein